MKITDHPSTRRTKIVCTLGPATSSQAAIARLARAGMEVARLNFSYGTHADHARAIANLRAVSRALDRPIGILQDLAGPKLRIGDLPREGLQLHPRQEVVLSASPTPATSHIPLPWPQLPAALSPGQRLLLADGKIELHVLATTKHEIRCRARIGGLLRSHNGIALPDSALPIPTVTRKDLADLRFGVAHEVDWVAMSFVRSPDDLLPLRRAIKRAGRQAALMAKIETHEAIAHLEEIIAAADGLMVARGDLGIELPLDRVPMLQKTIVSHCNTAGKPVITATQMLESMITSPRPTRAEVSDIANAVLDGTDAVMLSAETAVGRYPTEAVQMMARVIAHAEAAFDFPARLAQSSQWPCHTLTEAISQATCNLAHDLRAKAIITATTSGHTALMVAKHRPQTPIVAVTPHVATLRRLTLAWGVHPLLAPRGRDTDELILNAIARAQEAGFVRQGDLVVITAGVPAGVAGRTNLIKVEVVGRYHRF